MQLKQHPAFNSCVFAWVCLHSVLLASSFVVAEYPQDERPYPAKGYAWENNTLGMEERVPVPWVPLTYQGDNVECWGRRYAFGSGAWPTQISSQKLDLFATPPKVEWRVDGRDVVTSFGGTVTQVMSAAHKSVRTWESKTGSHRVKVATSLEYDGFLHVSLRLVPEGNATIERLVLNFTMPRSLATLMNRFEEYDFELQHVNHDNVLGTASSITKPIKMGFNPSVWIGNHQVGLEWSCESNAGWSPMKSPDAIQIVHGKDLTRLTINCITQPRNVEGPFELSFALMPTPSKPRLRDWRRLRLTTAMNETAGYVAEDQVFGFAMGLPVKFRGLPLMVPSTEKSAHEIAQLRELATKNKAGFIPYGAFYGMPALLPEGEWQDYASTWRVDPQGASVANVNWGNALGLPKGAESLIYVCPSQRSFQDFLVWQYVQAVEKEHISGVYFDISAPNFTCVSPGHEHAGRKRAGRDHASVHEEGWQYYPLFSQRRLMQRLYVACRERDPNFLITQHCAMQAAVTSTFTDVVIKGEALNRTFKQKHYTPALAQTDATAYVPDYGLLPDNYFELHFTPQQGPLLMLLPQVVKTNDELMRREPELNSRYTRIMLARSAVCDVPVMKSHADLGVCSCVERAQVRSGIVGAAAFHGPWEAGKYLSSGGQSLSVGLYFKPTNGSVALILVNLGKSTVQESIGLNLAALADEGIRPAPRARVISAFTDEETQFEGEGPIQVELAANDMKVIVWE
ncbi:MAG: DUF6067 family protein [Pirellulaceae bacterium]|nr:DUF6067 family protein [Pirellulaceae bacterium]